MAHYRTIEVDGKLFKYVVGNHRTKILKVDPDGSAGGLGGLVGTFYNSQIGHVYDEDHISVRPSHIEAAIRKALKMPMREYDWDKPATKKDPGPKTRGFRNLIGARIGDVRVSAINEVILEAEDGARYAINTESSGSLGIGVISLRVLTGTEDED